MIPICAVLTLNCKVVKEARARWNGTLCNSYRSIHPIRAILIKAMPVQRCPIDQLVCDIDEHTIASIRSNERARKLPIDDEQRTKYTLLLSYRRKRYSRDKILPSGAACISLMVKLKSRTVGDALASQFILRSYSKVDLLHDCTFSEASLGAVGLGEGAGLVGFVAAVSP
jgi:hypothetical protein